MVAMSALRAQTPAAARGERDAGASAGAKGAKRAASTRLGVGGQPLVACTYPGMRCAGCGVAFGKRAKTSEITPGGAGMIHTTTRCLELAQEALIRDARGASGRDVQGVGCHEGKSPDAAVECDVTPRVLTPPEQRDSEQRRVQLLERLSANRRERVRRCLQGKCGVTHEVAMQCVGVGGVRCTSRLHGVACAQLSKGTASIGWFKCAQCRVRQLLKGEAAVCENAAAV